MADATTLPLEGFRVLDMTTVIFGPYTTMMLGDFGAEVIKIEPPGGDMTRAIGPARNPGMSSLFLGANRNKRSIVLDLKRDQAKDALWQHLEEQLSARGRVVLSLVYTDGLSVDEAAARMGVKKQVVYNWQHKIRGLTRAWAAA